LKTQITGRHIDITDAMTTSINSTFSSIEKYSLNISNIHAIVSTLDKNKHFSEIELVISIPGQSNTIIKASDSDFYKAISLVTEKAEKFIRRFHDKNISLKRKQQKNN
jgi:putative sigma-54 modulation protein